MKVLSILSLVAVVVQSHSTVICTDLSDDFQTCRGFARNLQASYYSSGFNARGNDGYLVPKPASTSTTYQESYTTEMPMAQATPGKKMRLSWPANNHARPFGDSISQTAMNINIYQTNADGNVAGLQPYTTLNYETNCEERGKFDERLVSGAASPTQLCWGDVNMPQAEGKYTFVWEWKWPAPAGTAYMGVWDVQVGTNLSPAPAPAPAPATGTTGTTGTTGNTGNTGGCDESVCQMFQATCVNGGCSRGGTTGGGSSTSTGTGSTGGCTAGGNAACARRGQTCARQVGNTAYCGSSSQPPNNMPNGGATQCPDQINTFCKGMGCAQTSSGGYRCGTQRSGFGRFSFETTDISSTDLSGASKLAFSWALAIPLIVALFFLQ